MGCASSTQQDNNNNNNNDKQQQQSLLQSQTILVTPIKPTVLQPSSHSRRHTLNRLSTGLPINNNNLNNNHTTHNILSNSDPLKLPHTPQHRLKSPNRHTVDLTSQYNNNRRPTTSTNNFIPIHPNTNGNNNGIQSMRLHTAQHRPTTSLTLTATQLLIQPSTATPDRHTLVSRRSTQQQQQLLSDTELAELQQAAIQNNNNNNDNHNNNNTTTIIDTSISTNFNWSDPVVFSGRMNDCFNYYAKSNNKDYIDKKGIQLMSNDCVNYTIKLLRDQLKAKYKTYDDQRIDRELYSTLYKYLPYSNNDIGETKEIIEYYLRNELKMTDNLISREKYFLLFNKIHDLMFSNKLTVEREAMIDKLNRQHKARQENYIKSMKMNNNNKENNSNNNKNDESISMTGSKRNNRKTTHRHTKRSSNTSMFDLSDNKDSILMSPSSAISIPEESTIRDRDNKKKERRKTRKSSND